MSHYREEMKERGKRREEKGEGEAQERSSRKSEEESKILMSIWGIFVFKLFLPSSPLKTCIIHYSQATIHIHAVVLNIMYSRRVLSHNMERANLSNYLFINNMYKPSYYKPHTYYHSFLLSLRLKLNSIYNDLDTYRYDPITRATS